MKTCTPNMIAKLQHWWKRRRCCYVYIYEDEPPPSSYPSTRKNTPASNEGVPEQTIITDNSEDSTPDFDITTVYTPVGETIIPRLMITKVTSTTTRSSSQCDNNGPRFGTVQVKDYFVSSRSGASLCSMDSLTDSYWGASSRQGSVTADDDVDHQPLDDYFFNEHVRYLRIQTAPQQVEVVWSPTFVPSTTTRGRAVERFWYED
jgi:hypothetical protein